MTVYTPTHDYPKKYPLNLSEQEKKSFDINDKKQVAEFINIALKHDKIKSASKSFEIGGQIIEGMLEHNFGEYLDNRSYREFVMDYVVNNFKDKQINHERICRGLKNSQ